MNFDLDKPRKWTWFRGRYRCSERHPGPRFLRPQKDGDKVSIGYVDRDCQYWLAYRDA